MGFDNVPSILSGKIPGTFENLSGPHEHAYYLCEPDHKYEFVSHICVFAPAGFEPEHLLLLSTITELWSAQQDRILLEPDAGDPFADSVVCGTSRYWKSATPYMLARHLRIKRSEKHIREVYEASLERELFERIRSDLSVRNYPEPVSITFNRSMGLKMGDTYIPWRNFKRTRSAAARQPAINYGHGFFLEFKKPIRGPLALGYASHFGLGVFIPVI